MSHDDTERLELALEELHDEELDRPARAGFSSQSQLSWGGEPAAAALAIRCPHRRGHPGEPIEAAGPGAGRA